VRKGDRSVLVVKQAAPRPYRRVLVAVDFSDHSRHALELALRLAQQAEFHALHVYAGFEGMLRGSWRHRFWDRTLPASDSKGGAPTNGGVHAQH
jgi:hypothetical protein